MCEKLVSALPLHRSIIDMNRRKIMQNMCVAITGPYTRRLDVSKSAVNDSLSTIDINVINFFLNLEYLEAEFYLRAATGRGLIHDDIDGPVGVIGQVIGGKPVLFADDAVRNYALEIADEERRHVQWLRKALGNQCVARPTIDFMLSFTVAANDAGLIGPTSFFDAFADDASFLLACFLLETLRTATHLKVAPLISDNSLLSTVNKILVAKAYHIGLIRALLYAWGLSAQSHAILNAQHLLVGAMISDNHNGMVKAGGTLLDDRMKISQCSVKIRDALSIVYLNVDAQPAGFFPCGVNGVDH